MWFWRLMFLLRPSATASAAAANCFCCHSKNAAWIISEYLQYAYWPWGICPVNFFRVFFSFFNKIKAGRQNLMSLSRAWTASWSYFMFDLKEKPYRGHVLISFWCDSDFAFQNIRGYFRFAHSGYHHPGWDYFKIFAECILAQAICLINFCLRFPVSWTKSKMAAKIQCYSLELELKRPYPWTLCPNYFCMWLQILIIHVIKKLRFFYEYFTFAHFTNYLNL